MKEKNFLEDNGKKSFLDSSSNLGGSSRGKKFNDYSQKDGDKDADDDREADEDLVIEGKKGQ